MDEKKTRYTVHDKNVNAYRKYETEHFDELQLSVMKVLRVSEFVLNYCENSTFGVLKVCTFFSLISTKLI